MTSATGATYLERFEAAAARIERLAAATPAGMTAPSETGDRWEAGQVWAHVAEFLSHWSAELRAVVEGRAERPYGRHLDDPGRLGSIEQDRHTAVSSLMERIRTGFDNVRQLLVDIPDADYDIITPHTVLGSITIREAVEKSLVGHLEEHATQLENLEDVRAAAGKDLAP